MKNHADSQDMPEQTTEEWIRQYERQRIAALFVTGAAIVAVIVVYFAIVSALNG